ncbi:hypothetical protein WA1_28435 [Scytonema hofmannii PCC 7110]|uniref:DUF11 domain-containing protein n=1 Tax=Scytonema hofmannii PCC 7110 TaxID=128403 RepID=A0A139X5D2_9CYAN|nr:DUF11 domain-containing protein [Scytonema hofmannii]KYC39900.1 hypothetical protein WA1_28435 [Scytonema hofmannii PCC 7110]
MTFISSWLRHKSLFFTFTISGIFAYSFLPSVAQTPTGVITNTAGSGAGNITETRSSNPVTFRAGQAALQILKTGDRAAAEPGDNVIYRLAIRNSGTSSLPNLTIADRLPVGLQFVPRTLQGSIGGTQVPLTANATSNRTVTITSTTPLQPNQTLDVRYAVEVTPDAIQGTGRNLAQASSGNLRSNQASHLVRIRPGIVSDCGTLIGRVFVDKNFDGEQQPNEPGIPNAVIYMDDGNRIVTDPKGLFSLANVIPGHRTATLDLTSLPGYGLAPNTYFIERNSQSRLVKLAPNSMARVNFGVTPAFSEDKR